MTTITSIDAQFTQQQIQKSSSSISESAANLSSGTKLNANVADLSVGTVLQTRVSTLRTTVINAGQAKSLLNTAKGALQTIGDLLQQQKSLATKAADDSLTSNERGFLDQEFQSLTDEINRIATNTNFNGKGLIDGSISGKAALDTSTTEATENYTLTNTDFSTEFTLGGTVATGSLASGSGAATFTKSGAIGTTRTVATLDFTQGATGGASTIVLNDGSNRTISFSASANDATTTASNFVDAARTYQLANNNGVRDLVFINNGNGTVTVKGADLGTDVNGYTFDATGVNLAVSVNGGADVVAGAAATIISGTPLSTGAVRGNTTTQTFNENLLGSITNITGAISADSDGTYSATFTADVGGTTYTSQPVYLISNSAGTSFKIGQGQAITFTDPNGPVDTNGILSDNSFNLVVGTTDVTVNGTTLATLQDGINTVASGFETQLADAKLVQQRNPNLDVVSATDPSITSALGNFLNGIQGYDATNNAQGDVLFQSDGFGTDTAGSIGSLGAFSFDKDTGILSTTLDGVTYSADLTSNTDTTGTTGQGYITNGGGAIYSTSTKTFTLGSGVIHLATSDTTDARQVIIDLANVNTSSVDVLTDTAANDFAGAFNTLFGVATNDSLSFQVGVASTDSIGVSIDSAKTTSLYKDDSGIVQSLNVLTLTDAQSASNVLDNAINSNIALTAAVEATSTRFDSAIQNNLTSIQNADAARSNLLDTDFSQESTKFAEATVSQDAAVSVLAQLNKRIQNLLQLLR